MKKKESKGNKYTRRIKELRRERDLPSMELKAIKKKLSDIKRNEVVDKLKEGKRLNLPTDLYEEQLYGTKDVRNLKSVKIGVQIAGNKLASAAQRIAKEKVFGTAHAKIKKIPSSVIMKQFASTHYGEIKQGKDYSQVPEQDNRSLFFQSEYSKVKNNAVRGNWI